MDQPLHSVDPSVAGSMDTGSMNAKELLQHQGSDASAMMRGASSMPPDFHMGVIPEHIGEDELAITCNRNGEALPQAMSGSKCF